MNQTDFLTQTALRISGVNPRKCMKCGKCSGTCPNYDRMEYHPHQFVAMVEHGEIDGKQLHEDHHHQHDEVAQPLVLEPPELLKVLLKQPRRRRRVAQPRLVRPAVCLHVDAKPVGCLLFHRQYPAPLSPFVSVPVSRSGLKPSAFVSVQSCVR